MVVLFGTLFSVHFSGFFVFDEFAVGIWIGLVIAFLFIVVIIHVLNKGVSVFIVGKDIDDPLVIKVEKYLFGKGFSTTKASYKHKKAFDRGRRKGLWALIIHDKTITEEQKSAIDTLYEEGHTIRWYEEPPTSYDYPTLKKLPYNRNNLLLVWIVITAMCASPLLWLDIVILDYTLVDTIPGSIAIIFIVYILPVILTFLVRKPIIRRAVQKTNKYKNCKHIERKLKYRKIT